MPAQILPSHTKTMEIHVPYINKACFGDVNISSHHANVVSVPFIFDGELLSIKFAPFFCVYIPRHSINKVGLLDAELGRHYRSDRLYCNSVINIGGMEVIYVPNSKVFHGLQKSTDLLKKEDVKLFDAMFKRNEWDEDDLRDLGFSNRGWSL